jgi:peptide deformylase
MLEIITVPNKKLYSKSQPVLIIDSKIKDLAYQMLDTMYENQGIGLAAIQVGIPQRLIVIDLQEDNFKPMIIINPIVLSVSNDQSILTEGCLSVPEKRIDVIRPIAIDIKYHDENGKEHRMHAENLLAKCIQHEIDHLNGITILEQK